jgi:polysaccharide pyruvyl transferase WcaK-like protein
MLQASISRLNSMWNDSKIQVLTNDPLSVRRLCPNAEPLIAAGRARWLSMSHARSGSVSDRLRLWMGTYLRSGQRNAVNSFRHAVGSADLVIVTGMGGITDAFPIYARDLLTTVDFALQKGRYVAMVGQGLGPLLDPELVSLARKVLPRVGLIALREDITSGPLLLSLGVQPDRIVTTGDDAIETAYRIRTVSIGECLGVNVRAADYSGVTPTILFDLRQSLNGVSRSLGGKTIAIPISSVPGEADEESAAGIYSTVCSAIPRPASPEDVIKQVQRCRLVITGSYHAGVFALASGIPVIGLAKSKYYINKFEGLSAQFGRGCEVALIGKPGFDSGLREKAEQLWSDSANLRPLLLAQAAKQIETAYFAYARIKAAVDARLARDAEG